ncbi:MAG: Fic family protein [Bacilli bacterium]|nr:Fic family protein [Bacilli bacterium]
MIKVVLTNEILNSILDIEKNKELLNQVSIPVSLSNKFRKNTKKRSTYASNKIEGNPLTFDQVDNAIENKNRHLLKPEQEIKNYYLALEFLEKKLEKKVPISLKLILDVQKQICEGEPKEKIGLRGPMPPGVLFAVWNDDGTPAYIPPEYSEVESLLNELITYLNKSTDHPIIKAAVVHYQLVTIHPFEDGNGRTARILSSYYLSLSGYGFKNVGSLEEYMSYNIDEYYDSIQMNLPVLYYDGRNNPPHSEIWFNYFLKVFGLYASKVLSLALKETQISDNESFSYLSNKAKNFLSYLRKHNIKLFTPIELSKKIDVTNRTIINWCVELSNNGFIEPIVLNKRVRKYKVN